jgi:hypothetical protein
MKQYNINYRHLKKWLQKLYDKYPKCFPIFLRIYLIVVLPLLIATAIFIPLVELRKEIIEIYKEYFGQIMKASKALICKIVVTKK